MIAPVLPFGGVAGWNFLSRTIETQKEVVTASPSTQRDLAYFRERIGSVESAQDLVEDFTLMKVALGAFGLQDDQANRFFIGRVLEEGTFDRGSLANRLSDPRYKALSDAFGFGDLGGPWTSLPGFADRIVSAYRDQTFEVAVGKVDSDMRLALGMSREIDRIVDSFDSDDARWFGVIGAPPVRAVFEKALGLPESFAGLDIDRQLSIFRARSEDVFGVSEVSDFASPETRDALRDRFLLMSELSGGGPRSATAPIISLFSGSAGAASILQVLYSR
ncbi:MULTISPECIES: DUF1217 domain-containing protein [Meridianimarinicoccus]|uniref:DUF1217 domain-containing protein n=1 Tax=Meridianimarinicoccus zhengii TaxID=2056810 RepID=UPI000DAE5D7E|nr:DUF1217 domain-containing protein [Phycocomes zhengii]